MKQILLTLLIILFYSIGYSQQNFVLTSHVGIHKISINGIIYFTDSIGVKIPTNYPIFDTLIFKAEFPGSNSPIICNFKPDTIYTISMACCGSRDIIPLSKFENDSLKYWDLEKDFDKIQNQFMDKPFISIRTRKKPQDSIYAWHADAACRTEHNLISTDLWKLGVPPKCFYWNNITSIVFFKKSKINETIQEKHSGEFLGFDNIKILSNISFRLFDNERFVLIFDYENKAVKLEYE